MSTLDHEANDPRLMMVRRPYVPGPRGLGSWNRRPDSHLFLKKNKAENRRNSLGAVILQKDPSSLFYLCFSPCNFPKTPSNFSKILFSFLKLFI
jgi:hypothetical protein